MFDIPILLIIILCMIAIILGIVNNFNLVVLKKSWKFMYERSILLFVILFLTIFISITLLFPTNMDQTLLNFVAFVLSLMILIQFPYRKKWLEIPLILLPTIIVLWVYGSVKYFVLLYGITIESAWILAFLYVLAQFLLLLMLFNNTLSKVGKEVKVTTELRRR